MLVQLNENPIAGGGVKKKDIKAMVDHYRSINPFRKRLKYAHFKVSDVLELFAKNNAIPLVMIKLLEDPEVKKHLGNYGVKIYLGRHNSLKTCPQDGESRPEDYMDKATTILCNTDISETTMASRFKGFKDILKDQSFLLIPSKGKRNSVEPGDGLDQAEIAPPFNTDGGGPYDIGEY